ncbi:hypothetical protein P3L51_11155 [Streptomyces sp. PSRA5]|uniref:hypothetical protein n=1 Tax=Streptomyces panacea TaxID=3035064 RepID=UPI00339D0CEB
MAHLVGDEPVKRKTIPFVPIGVVGGSAADPLSSRTFDESYLEAELEHAGPRAARVGVGDAPEVADVAHGRPDVLVGLDGEAEDAASAHADATFDKAAGDSEDDFSQPPADEEFELGAGGTGVV